MKIVNGTSYHDETSLDVIKWLETSRERKQKIRVWYGENGRCWNDVYDTIGYIGRSTGMEKIPILIKNSRSMGGGAILDHCIVRIDTKNSNDKIITVYDNHTTTYDHFITTDTGKVYDQTNYELCARCKNKEAGERLARFMNGERWAK